MAGFLTISTGMTLPGVVIASTVGGERARGGPPGPPPQLLDTRLSACHSFMSAVSVRPVSPRSISR